MVPRNSVTTPVGRRSRVIRRRRQNFERLLGLATLTLILGFVPGLHWMWFVHLAVDGALGIYVSRLLRYKNERLEQTRKVSPISADEPAAKQVSSL